MFKLDANAIKDKVIADQPVQIELTWNLPNPHGRIEYEIWTTPADIFTEKFFADFKHVAISLRHHAYFTPRMLIHDGTRSYCTAKDKPNACSNLCTNKGRYCGIGMAKKGISGAEVVRESLRRICIWKMYGYHDGVGSQWWDYVRRFNKRCNKASLFSNEDCVAHVCRRTNIDKFQLDRCMEDSGGTAEDIPNAFLDLELRAKAESGAVTVPTAYINNVGFRNTLSVDNVLSAICATISPAHYPKICRKQDIVIIETSQTTPSVFGCYGLELAFLIALYSVFKAWRYAKNKRDESD